MTGIISVIGVDPGPTTGICFLDYRGYNLAGKTIAQVDGHSALIVLEAMMSRYYRDPLAVTHRFAGVEEFVTGESAGTRGSDAEYTRQLVFTIAEQLQLWGYSVKIRSAAEVKPWGTDTRLIEAGIAKAPAPGQKGELHGKLRDGYDAARHALYTAKHDAYRKDPLR